MRYATLFLLCAVVGHLPVCARDQEDDALAYINRPWTGDLDGMVTRGYVRILTVHNPLFFTFDGIKKRGLGPELARLFEEHLAKEIGRVTSPQVVLIPVARDELLAGLLAGRGDIAVGNLSITPEREKLVEFSKPLYPNVSELVITGPAAPNISSFDDLVATGVTMRRSSSYFAHMSSLNGSRRKSGKKVIPVNEADENLEDFDLLDMVNAGLLEAIVVDSHKAAFWVQVFPKIVVHKDLVLHSGGRIAWAFRKDSPKLRDSVNAFTQTIKKGTLLGNLTLKRYLGNADWARNALASEDRRRYDETIEIIRKYAEMYDFDWLMIAAQAYQESQFDQSKTSKAGAVGIMQVLPTTAADPIVGIPDISRMEDNIHAGVRYLRWLRDTYFSSEEIDPLDRMLLSFAAYNAGPGNTEKARRRTLDLGFDPNRWFGNVEIGMYRAVSGEPASYVRNIYKYYITYRRLEETRKEREKARKEADS